MKGLSARAILICLILLVGSAASNAADYTLEDLYRIGMQKSEKVKISGENVEIANSGKYKALSVAAPEGHRIRHHTNYTDEKRNPSGSIIQPDSQSVWGAAYRRDPVAERPGVQVLFDRQGRCGKKPASTSAPFRRNTF